METSPIAHGLSAYLGRSHRLGYGTNVDSLPRALSIIWHTIGFEIWWWNLNPTSQLERGPMISDPLINKLTLGTNSNYHGTEKNIRSIKLFKFSSIQEGACRFKGLRKIFNLLQGDHSFFFKFKNNLRTI